MRTERITVWGLRDDPEKHFQQNYMFITKNDFRNIFMPHLEAIAELMTKQLNEAKKTEHAVKKVVLVGGFSSSQSLRNYLRQRLLKLSKLWGYKIRLYDTVYAGVPETAIAHGAVLRAMNKEKGPKRIAQCSYGFLRTEPYREWDEHKGVKPFIDELDGEKYVRDTIDWLVKKDAEVEYHEEHIIDAYHLFPAYRRVFKFEEVLYVSDTSFESHYKKSHKKNKGSEVAGRIIADMSFLVKENIIQPIMPDPMSGGKPHYKIEFQLVMIIDGRNLRYEARWPKGNDARVHGSGQICIAAAFQPGTD
ncbi:hypothetical protein OIDMADRAFT_19679 [Oidiodendron maius Zn]|uniref:Uncharacterized protein n=1 Tax=Oidiodendron maius (strain Zn) TaxID=913774 RepID=A0A0C3CKN3_OIDMZ|nr:hypothetical protein OIDMADRAFT_19679 [Oidiodendron maius Zn]